MEPPLVVLPTNYGTSNEFCSNGFKRTKLSSDSKDDDDAEKKPKVSSNVIDYSDPFASAKMLEDFNSGGTYGSVTKDLEALISRNTQLMSKIHALHPYLSNMSMDAEKTPMKESSKAPSRQLSHLSRNSFIDLEDESVGKSITTSASSPVVILDSDDEDDSKPMPLHPVQAIVLRKPPENLLYKEIVMGESNLLQVGESNLLQVGESNLLQVGESILLQALESNLLQVGESNLLQVGGSNLLQVGESNLLQVGESNLFRVGEPVGKRVYKKEKISPTPTSEIDVEKDPGVYVGVEEDVDAQTEAAIDDGLGDIWQEMSMALEFSKDTFEDPSNERMSEEDEDCDHSFVLKDDLGYVCRICGVIERGIETIIDIQYNKAKKSTNTYASEPRNRKYRESIESGVKLSEDDFTVTEITAHPRHMKQMKPHQVEGFHFLLSNLVADPPGGCILAHAPGSGKTFMIISFMQSFLVKKPQAKPLVVLPKGILATWKKEFETWQVEDIPLLDFYSVKADNRSQQLEVLKKWVQCKSILFLGYKQFSTIMCDSGTDQTCKSCQQILKEAPSILILDEGHTPRNDNTDVWQSLQKVDTARKVVLSGTLYQNHVKEVFNILNLVRPKFLRLDTSKSIKKRIMSKVDIAGARKLLKAGADAAFYDLVEHTLQKDENFDRKVSVIDDLREMTSKVLHYYKGDFLDELPGLIDFTVVLSLTPIQKDELRNLKRKYQRKFKISSAGSAIYLHPKLSVFSENSESDATDDKMDELLNKLDVKEGVKAKFFFNMLNLCESAGEKLLVFSPYLTPLKFLERLSLKLKGWQPGIQVFSITGESSSDHRERSMDRFNNSPDAKVFFGSIKACGEGISLVGASRIIVLDVHLNPSVTRQAIGRAFRPGQKKKVYVYRLIAGDSPEEEDHNTCFKKELISKMWFEWNKYCGNRDFDVETVDLNECNDLFLESQLLREDIRGLYRR